jgi:hypothetical protein
MRKFAIALSVLGALVAMPTLAQGPARTTTKSEKTISPGEVSATPEMWFYQQYMRQYEDPKMAVRHNAEFRAEQRANRLAAMQWFGFSNSRPRASSDPWHGDYSPMWTANNSWYSNRWVGAGRPTVVVPADSTRTHVLY